MILYTIPIKNAIEKRKFLIYNFMISFVVFIVFRFGVRKKIAIFY